MNVLAGKTGVLYVELGFGYKHQGKARVSERKKQLAFAGGFSIPFHHFQDENHEEVGQAMLGKDVSHCRHHLHHHHSLLGG